MDYIACYGDSLVQGFPFGQRYSWIVAVEKAAPLKMLNYGVCGDCCDDIIYRMRQYPLPEYVQHVLFLGGANDILQGRSLEHIITDYKRLLSFCEEKSYKLCIVLPLLSSDKLMNRHLLNLKQAVSDLCAKRCFLLDLQPSIGSDEKSLKNAYLDGLHPKAPTYEAMGVYAMPYLIKWTSIK
ncbi:MAG: GDSL-type esterase/lipase family protein [Phascolarctobacterium sp.]|nr:GDSL-type esterase/lipase family protein [Phascolarctobacterium sp.]